ncbi:MAG: Long-chain-fatty-acid--CoA ligase [Acidimicrobiales bacterium]|nr:MAG: acyl-CoA synthetase [Actinomycetota bacterium]MBV6508564.1 Long-chain-fatty-acid--CoA ligase [Acidimicrobiales bacterium]RIK05126.1 MAG: acyl-CoA synthetase [Acidobacteriota bacterium]
MLRRLRDLVGVAATELEAVGVLARAGMLNPRQGLATVAALRKWKEVTPAGYAAWASLTPHREAIIDETGSLTFSQVHGRTNAIATGLAEAGVKEGDNVAVLCRNHRGFVESAVAVGKLGADTLFLNTGFAGPALADVLDREGTSGIIFDEEFTDLVESYGGDGLRVSAEQSRHRRYPSLGDLIAEHDNTEPTPPTREGRQVILTSGTTGTPKGANRPNPPRLPSTAAALLSRIPYRTGETMVVPAPLFHAWGLGHLMVAASGGCCLVLCRRFDAEKTLELVDRYGATVLAVVPVMLQRILGLDTAVINRHDTSTLRIVASSGAALPGGLAVEWMDTFGDNLYNLYGSTEVAQATIASPEDMRAAPGTAGRPPVGTVVKILDSAGQEVPQGEIGRIFVGNRLQFDGYTGGGGKEMVGGLMSTGDMGYVDEDGRLFVGGRDDDMIVSGGENVFPREVEDLLSAYPGVDDVAVIGVDDEEFGQRLKAFVVQGPGADLSDRSLLDHVKASLARYKIPREVVFLDELPRNPTGKVLKRKLREM